MWDWFSQREEAPATAEMEAKAPEIAEPEVEVQTKPAAEDEPQDTKEEFVNLSTGHGGMDLALGNSSIDAAPATDLMKSSTRNAIATERLKEALSKIFQLNKHTVDERVGMGLMQRKNGLAVVAIAPDCLAAKAGIRIGHRVLSIDGKQVTVAEANKLLSAAVGPISLDVLVPPARPPMKPALKPVAVNTKKRALAEWSQASAPEVEA
jgi:C-terminal processing protease CtpA/Prc